MRQPRQLLPYAANVTGASLLLTVALLLLDVQPARAHGANFRDPSDSPPRSARPSPQVPAPPVTTAESSSAMAPAWKPEGWYRWWELNAAAFLPARPPRAPPAKPATTPEALPDAAAPWQSEHRRVVADLLRLADPTAKTEPRLLAAVLVGLGRLSTDTRVLAVLKRYAGDRPAGFQIREAALVGLGLMRRDDPARRLSLECLRTLRAFLLARAGDTQEPARTRACALFALGLLADQGHDAGALTRGGRQITRELWKRLGQTYASVEISIALLTALGLQPAEGVPDGVVEGLKWMALGKHVRDRIWNHFERAHAATTLARLGKPGTDAFLLRLAGDARRSHPVRAATALALMRRAPRMAPEARLAAVQAVAKGVDAAGTHWLVRSLLQLAVGALLAADLEAGSSAVLDQTDVDSWLRRHTRSGPREARPFCALAVALAWRGRRRSMFDLSWGWQRAVSNLDFGLRHGGRSDRTRGAYAIALGLMDATSESDVLREHLKDRERDGVLRGHCAAALGMLGQRDQVITRLLQATTRERGHVFLHLQAARALGWLGAQDAYEGMRRDFVASDSPPITGALALGLAALDDPRAFEPLRARLLDPKQHVGVRVSCAIALASLFDPEPGSSARRMTVHANYPAVTGAYRRFLDRL